jgi:hypothetical protein
MNTAEHDTFGIRHLTVIPENFDPGADDGRSEG